MSTIQPQNEGKVSLKVVIDKKGKRILYAEADKTFIDFLFTILALPVGTVVKLLSTAQDMHMVGSLGSLYRSVESLSIGNFEANQHKDSLLKPDLPTATTSQSQIRSLLQIQPSLPPKKYYTCSAILSTNCITSANYSATCRYSFSATNGAPCPRCFQSMSTFASYVYGAGEAKPIEGGYVKGGMATYMVMDDLTVKPMSCSSMSIISVLNELNVENVGQVDDKLIYLDVQDGVKLLRASLYSSTVLTDLFLSRIDFSEYYSGTKINKDGMEGKN